MKRLPGIIIFLLLIAPAGLNAQMTRGQLLRKYYQITQLHNSGKDAEAIADVNVIRKRAGIPEWKNLAEAQTHEYKDALSVVLDERRMELCFEGHRAFEVYRNKLAMDRRFAGVQPWEVVQPDDLRIPYQIPDDEILVSGIEQNPR